MFCYQCQETAKNTGCTAGGVCGKSTETAELQDLLVYVCKGISLAAEKASKPVDRPYGRFLLDGLFATITNAATDVAAITAGR